MKLFQNLLLAPAALGLIAPLSADATEINLKGVSNYAPIINTFQTASELGDIHPGDWTFQALTDLRNARGCNVSLPKGVITRAEAAAILNQCVGNANKLNDTELRLIDEFATELATLRGTEDVLSSFSFEAGSFSPTTVLSGSINFVAGARSETDQQEVEGVYEVKYSLTSSFTGKDSLVAEYELGNGGTLGIDPVSDLGGTDAVAQLTDLYYSFPVTDKGTICLGALMDGDACLAGTYTAYSEPVFNGGNDYWSEDIGTGVAVGGNYVFDSGLNVSANIQSGKTGVLASASDNITGQIGYDAEGWGGAFTYTDFDSDDSAYGLGLYVAKEGWPTVTVGWDTKDQSTTDYKDLNSFFIGAETSAIGDGTLGASFQNKETGTTVATGQNSYEIFYAYPVNDYLTLTPSIWTEENAAQNGTDDATGYAVTVGFTF